jgi:5-methylcytosine-specific restriction protein B
MFENMDKTDLLKSSKNLILTGAPGVGKTYKTAEIAVAIADSTFTEFDNRKKLMLRYKSLTESGQITFTTFHQSLDYEEFVEGLKPDTGTDGSGTGSYSVKPGIFKEICGKARRAANIDAGGVDNFEDAWNNLVEKLDADAIIDIHLLSGRGQFGVELNEYGTGLANRSYKDGIFERDQWISGQSKFFSKDQLYNVYRGLKGVPSGGHDNYRKAIIAEMKANYGLAEYKEVHNSSQTNHKNFILIIDEINRGNISKIFGELITLLERDKRLGEENEITVTLPYSQEKFGVPSNFYIIGTMNSADRSIGAIDYALRRRFVFVSLKSDKTVISNYPEYHDDTKTKAETLFENVKAFIGSNINADLDADDLMIGHSYFLCKTGEELKRRLEYEIIPLLWEYQKDGILTCEREALKNEIAKWQNLQ